MPTKCWDDNGSLPDIGWSRGPKFESIAYISGSPPQEAKNQNKKTKSTTQSAWWSYEKEKKILADPYPGVFFSWLGGGPVTIILIIEEELIGGGGVEGISTSRGDWTQNRFLKRECGTRISTCCVFHHLTTRVHRCKIQKHFYSGTRF